ncbi:RraA family protein [Bosea sp. BK604]|uniref:RraA family protein n=1 Tax=Bosea sp. BK604 TaxID=2512180 RepID=UPI00104C7CA3|nr:RraA family protein [Bosea sp. BK604]TCR70337.1 regulator of RNase E activity RraA [Bosea sp. BK604]
MPTRLDTPRNQRLPADLIDAWRAVPSSVIADQLGGAGHADPRIRPIRPFAPGQRLTGSAITAWCEPADYGPVHHAIAVAEAGDVVVVAADGRRDAAMIGDLLGGAARLKGIVGVVVDGAVRDIGPVSQWPDFVMFSRWVMPRGPSSMERGIVNGPIVFGGVVVNPYDLVIGDDDGLVFVPHALAQTKLEPSLTRVRNEAEWEKVLASGKTTVETFKVPAIEPL